jgi:hypothetical protein
MNSSGKKRPTTSKPRRPCQACGAKSADVRPDFNWDRPVLDLTYAADIKLNARVSLRLGSEE